MIAGYSHATLYQGNTSNRVLLVNGEKLDAPNKLTDLVQWQEANNIHCLWVMPDSDLSRNIQKEAFYQLNPLEYSWFIPPELPYDGQPYTVRYKRQKIDTPAWLVPDSREWNNLVRHNIDAMGMSPVEAIQDVQARRAVLLRQQRCFSHYLIFPAHMECCNPSNGDKGQWVLPSPYHLNLTLDYIESEIGIAWLWTSGHIGEELLRLSHQNTKTPIQPFTVTDLWQNIIGKTMDRPVWRKLQASGVPGLSEEDKECTFIIGVDKNGQYTGAASSVELGNGDYEEVEYTAYSGKSVGIWEYQITDVSGSYFDGYNLPCPLDVNKSWASTDLIEAALRNGVKLAILKGIVWKESGRYLEKWARGMWQHRAAFRDSTKYPNDVARDNAMRSMKIAVNSMVGRFMNEYSKEYSHQDWQIEIIHRAIASQAYTLARLAREEDTRPVLVNKDAFYFVTNESNLLETLGLLEHTNELRGFKQIGIAPLTPELIAAFNDRRLGVNDLELQIKKGMVN